MIHNRREYQNFQIALLFLLGFLFFKGSMAQPLVLRLEKQLKASVSDSAKARLTNAIAWEVRFLDPTRSIFLVNQSIEFAKNIQSFEAIALAYRTKGIALIAMNRKMDAVSAMDTAVFYGKKSKNLALEATCLNSAAGMFGDFGDFDKAIEIYSKGLEIAKRINDYTLISKFYNNLADAYQNTGRSTEMVQKYYTLALELSLKNKAWASAGLNSSNLAKEYSAKGFLTRAAQELEQSIYLLQKTEYGTYLFATTNNQIGSVYEDLKKYDLAKRHVLIAYRILDSLQMPMNALHPLLGLTNIEIKVGELETAKSHGNLLLKQAIARDAKVYIKEAYKSLSAISKLQGRAEEALTYFEQYKRWDDSVFRLDREKNISQMEFKSEIARRDLEVKYGLTVKEEENQILATSNRYLKRAIIISLFVFFMFAILGGLLYRSTKKKQLLNNQLQQKNEIVEKQAKEKDLLIHEIHHRVKNNLTMLQSLFYLQSKSAKSEDVKQVLTESQTRLLSMALVHQHLYENENEGGLELIAFIENLLQDISEAYTSGDHKKIEFHVSGMKNEIAIKLAIPLGLILNELITNSLKYAFLETDFGRIDVQVSETNEAYLIVYSDSGPGLNFEFDLNADGFGFRILKLLTKQMKASIHYAKGEGYSKFSLIVPKN